MRHIYTKLLENLNQATDSMEQSPSSEPNSCSCSQ